MPSVMNPSIDFLISPRPTRASLTLMEAPLPPVVVFPALPLYAWALAPLPLLLWLPLPEADCRALRLPFPCHTPVKPIGYYRLLSAIIGYYHTPVKSMAPD
jgi:hypothetical protein